MSKKQIICITSFSVFIFLFSLSIWFLSSPKKRYVFLFESFDLGKTCMEERFIANQENQISVFTDELLLGSQNSRYKNLFPIETHTVFCFENNKTLSVNFSGDIVKSDTGTSDISKGFELYKKNIFHNCKKVKNIVLFADGHEILD